MAKPQNPNKFYFSETEDRAIEEFIAAKTDAEREDIFKEKLYHPMAKLAECVFRSHHFPYVIASVGDQNAIEEGLSQLSIILPKFDKERGRAFSFFSYCLKNFYIQWNDRVYAENKILVSVNEIKSDEEDGDIHIHRYPIFQTRDGEHSEYDLGEFLKLAADYWDANRNVVCIKPRDHQILNCLIKLFRNPDVVDFNTTGHGFGKKETFQYLEKELGMNCARFRVFLNRIKPTQSLLLKEYLETKSLGTVKPKRLLLFKGSGLKKA